MSGSVSNLRKCLNASNWLTWRRLVGIIVAIRLLAAIGHCFAPVTRPHTWRQVDTMATALRFARRWTIETTDFPWWFPAVLNSGDTRGIMFMEFPLFNGIGALGFVVAGSDVDLGRSLAQFFALLTVFLLTFLLRWTWRRNQGFRSEVWLALILAPMFSFATPFTAKFIPDISAMLLCLNGVGLLWQYRSPARLVIALVFMTLGMLVKPTSAIVMALLLLHPDLWRAWRSQAIVVMLALVAPLYWYLIVRKTIIAAQEQPAMFALFEDAQPIQWIINFWSSYEIWELFHFHLIFQSGWIFIPAALWIIYFNLNDRGLFRRLLIILGIAVLQSTMIGLLSGDHARLHGYYLAGVAPTIALFIFEVWERLVHKQGNNELESTKFGALWCLLLGAAILLRASEIAVADLSGNWRKSQPASIFAECKQLRTRNPQLGFYRNQIWRTQTADQNFPLLDLCLGERGQSETSRWGLFYKEAKIPQECKPVDETERLVLVDCEQ